MSTYGAGTYGSGTYGDPQPDAAVPLAYVVGSARADGTLTTRRAPSAVSDRAGTTITTRGRG